MGESVSVQPPNPETNFDDFVVTVVNLKEIENGVARILVKLALIAVENRWVSTMAELWGVSRPTIYDWALVGKLFPDDELIDAPLWLYVSAGRMATQTVAPDRQGEVAKAIVTYCVANGVTPSEMKSILSGGLPPIVVTGEASAEYPPGKIVLTPKDQIKIQPNQVRYRLVSLDYASDTGQEQPEDVTKFINQILGTRTPSG